MLFNILPKLIFTKFYFNSLLFNLLNKYEAYLEIDLILKKEHEIILKEICIIYLMNRNNNGHTCIKFYYNNIHVHEHKRFIVKERLIIKVSR